jgi:EmrB/QacA subfamily drug resistance transporter
LRPTPSIPRPPARRPATTTQTKAPPIATTARPHPPARTGPSPHRWWTLAVLCLSLLIVFIGNSSLNVALPTLSRELHASESQLQWVVASYSLVFAGLLFTSGALGDRFGRKGALQLGLLLFLVGAGLAALSNDMRQLIACRAIMGAAAAFIMPSTLSIIINVFDPHERPKAIAIWASITGAAGGFGPLVSGFLLGHFWYGSIFLINVPIIVVALAAGHFLVPTSRDPEEASLDPVGAVLSIIGVVALVYGLIEAPGKGWASSTTLISFGIAFVILALFMVWELRVDEPMVDMHYFKNPAFSTGTGGMILMFLSMYGVLFLLTQYLQLVHGYSALNAAVRMLPIALIMLVVAPFTPKLSRKIGAHRVVSLGMLCVAGGFVVFTFLGLHTSYAFMMVAFIPLTAGIALTMSPMTASIMAAVPARRAGAGSAMNDASRELGAALGIAVLGSVAASKYSNQLHHVIVDLPPSLQAGASKSLAGALQAATQLSGAKAGALVVGAQQAFVDGMHVAALVGVVLCLIAAVLTYKFLPHSLEPKGAMKGPLESFEDAAELAVGGTPPMFADEADEIDQRHEAQVAYTAAKGSVPGE